MRYFPLLVLVLLCTGALSAQTSVGFRGGYGTSNLRTDKQLDLISDRLDATAAFSGGLYAEQAFSPVFSLRSGVEVNQRGTALLLSSTNTVFGMTVPLGGQVKTRFTYVDVPVLAQVSLPTNSTIRPYAFGGASFGYAVKGNVRTTATALFEFNLATTNVDLDAINYERFHVAAVGGLGVSAQLTDQLRIFAEGRYEQSLTQPYDVPLLAAKTGFRGLNFGGGVAFTF